MRQGFRGEQFQRRIVFHFAVFNDAAMPVVRVFAQTYISHDQQVQLGAANRFDGPLDHSVGRPGLASSRILLLRDAEQNDSRNAKLLDLAAFLEKFVHRLLRDTGHRADRIPHASPGTNKHRVKEALRRKPRFARQRSDRFAAPQAPRADYGKTHEDLIWDAVAGEKCFTIAAAIDSSVASGASIATRKPAFRRALAVTGPTAARNARAASLERTSAPSSAHRFSTADGLKNDTTSTRASRIASMTPGSAAPRPPEPTKKIFLSLPPPPRPPPLPPPPPPPRPRPRGAPGRGCPGGGLVFFFF